MDNHHHIPPWNLGMIYSLEPELERIAAEAANHRRREFRKRIRAYEAAKSAAQDLIGWSARDPRLRSREAWGCYFRHILDELRI